MSIVYSNYRIYANYGGAGIRISVLAGHFHDGGEVFVLVRSDKIDARSQCRLPADENRFPGTEIIAGVPTRACGWIEAVQSVKTNPISQVVRVVNQRAQAAIVGARPIASLLLAALLNHAP